MSHTMPDVPLSPETTESQPERATRLHAAQADLAKAFQLLQAEAVSLMHFEVLALIYLAREGIETAMRQPGEDDEGPTDA